MESPLSFDSTENFRKKLLLRNLKPYNVQGSFTSNETNLTKEIQIVDYSVVDSEDVEKIGNRQEKILYTNNKYGPTQFNSSYGDTVNINLNLNTETNNGTYGVDDTFNSKLYQVGNIQENLLYVQNIYGPTQFNTSYGETVDINKNLQTQTNQGVYGYPRTVNSKLEQIGNQKEIDLIVKNVYRPQNGNDFGDTVWFINDDKTITTIGSGLYNVQDTVGGRLETVGNQQEILNKIKNVYKPPGDDFGLPVYSINNDQVILTTGNGLYGLNSTINSNLEQIGNQQEILNKVKNVYKSTGNDFGTPVYQINNDLVINTIGNGEYSISDTINNLLEQNGNQQEIILRTKNKYTPNSGNDYGQTKYSINNDLIYTTNLGEYDISDTVGDLLETKGSDLRALLFPTNQYGPEAGQSTTTVNPNQNFQTHNFTWVSWEGKTSKMMISDQQIEIEKETIVNWMTSGGMSYEYADFTWDGQNLHGASCSGEYHFIASRSELIDYIEDLKQIPADHLKGFI